jgi:hypothetical protein
MHPTALVASALTHKGRDNKLTASMGANLKPANSAARVLLKKLQALAERGIDGEKTVAQRKIARLQARFDFSGPDLSETPDLFRGTFKHSTTARRVYTFSRQEYDVANSVKWAIESATGIPCLFRGDVLLAEANISTIKRLTKIANGIAQSFRTLLDQFSAIDGVSVSDRGVFVMGLYDGMMNEVRNVGQRLPSRARATKKPKGKKPALSAANHLDVHPYTLALGLGRQVRFSVPVEKITAELIASCAAALADKTTIQGIGSES